MRCMQTAESKRQSRIVQRPFRQVSSWVQLVYFGIKDGLILHYLCKHYLCKHYLRKHYLRKHYLRKIRSEDYKSVTNRP
jgi:hypothetical protein